VSEKRSFARVLHHAFSRVFVWASIPLALVGGLIFGRIGIPAPKKTGGRWGDPMESEVPQIKTEECLSRATGVNSIKFRFAAANLRRIIRAIRSPERLLKRKHRNIEYVNGVSSMAYFQFPRAALAQRRIGHHRRRDCRSRWAPGQSHRGTGARRG
jgi:hypothetical protein